MTFPGIPSSPSVGDEITAAQAQLIASDLNFLSGAPNGTWYNILGPATTLDITTTTAAVQLGPVAVNSSRSYFITASANFIKVTNSSTIACTLVETTSSFSPPMIPSATASAGDLPSGSFSGIWVPNAGQTTATWQIKPSSSSAALRLTTNCASIVMIDMGQ